LIFYQVMLIKIIKKIEVPPRVTVKAMGQTHPKISLIK